jgi:hypothetical protein
MPLTKITPNGRTLVGTECHFGKRTAESSIRVRMFGGQGVVDYTHSGASQKIGGRWPPMQADRG